MIANGGCRDMIGAAAFWGWYLKQAVQYRNFPKFATKCSKKNKKTFFSLCCLNLAIICVSKMRFSKKQNLLD